MADAPTCASTGYVADEYVAAPARLASASIASVGRVVVDLRTRVAEDVTRVALAHRETRMHVADARWRDAA